MYTCHLFLRCRREIFILGVLGFLKTTRSFPKIPEQVRSLPKTSEVCRRRSYRENAYHKIRDHLLDSWITGNDSLNFLILNYWNAQIVYQHAFPAFVYCDRYLWLAVVSWHWSILLPQVVEGLAVCTIQERTETSTVQPSGKGYVEKCQERCHPWGKLVILTFCIFLAGETAL